MVGDLLGIEFSVSYRERYKYEWDMFNFKVFIFVLRKKSLNINNY